MSMKSLKEQGPSYLDGPCSWELTSRRKSCAVGVLGVAGIWRLDFNFLGITVIAFVIVTAGVNHALYTRKMTTSLFNASTHSISPP